MVQSHQCNRPGVPGTAYPKDHFHSSIPAPRGCAAKPKGTHDLKAVSVAAHYSAVIYKVCITNTFLLPTTTRIDNRGDRAPTYTLNFSSKRPERAGSPRVTAS